MKKNMILSIFLIMLISGCATADKNLKISQNLPIVNGFKTISTRSSVAFEWSLQQDLNIQGYEIFRSKNNLEFTKIARIPDRYVSHFLDKNLEPDTNYKYFFKTYSKDNLVSQNSQIISVKTEPRLIAVPFSQAIYGLPERIKILWRPHPSNEVSGYELQRSLDGKKWQKIAKINGRLNVEYIDKSIKTAINYTYRVFAIDYDGVLSLPSQAVFASSKPLPTGVKGLKASKNAPKKIILTWDRELDNELAYFKIYKSANKLLPFFEVAKTRKNSYEDLIDENAATRYYKVSVVDKDGLESRFSNEISGSTLAAPLAPKLLNLQTKASFIYITWLNQDQKASKFIVTRKFKNQIRSFESKEGEFKDEDVIAGQKYEYEISAIDDYGLVSKPLKISAVAR